MFDFLKNIFTAKSASFDRRKNIIPRLSFEDLVQRYSKGEDLLAYPFEKLIAQFAFGYENKKMGVDDCMEWLLILYAQQEKGNETEDNIPIGLKAIYSINKLDGEINNGGFSQYFENTRFLESQGAMAKACLEALELMGSYKTKKLLEIAIERIEKAGNSRPPAWENHKPGKVFTEGSMYKGLDDLDKMHYTQRENLGALYLQRVKDHPEDFLMDGK